MDNRNQNTNINETARAVLEEHRPKGQGKQLALWIAALAVGGCLGCLGIAQLDELFAFIAAVFTRFFQFIAVPTIALAVITTLSELGADKNTKSIFAHAVGEPPRRCHRARRGGRASRKTRFPFLL